MPDPRTLILGAVAYDAKVVTIWDGFQQYFARQGLDFDYVLFSNYERQVEQHCRGQIHIAWNSPLAWLQTERVAAALGRRAEAICMRDTDRDLTSLVAARSGADIKQLSDLKSRRVAVGAKDSPQASLIPLSYLAGQGLQPGTDFEVVHFDLLAGKHGDHIGGEREAARALARGEVDAACMIDSNHLAFIREGTLASNSTRILARTPAYDHCNFTILDDAPAELVKQFLDQMLAMTYADAEVRPLLDMEGLKQWMPGRTEGYKALAEAVDRFGAIDSFVQQVAAGCRK
jgi:ABC-type phosphate/phosphonate transport system substrate-binding protein